MTATTGTGGCGAGVTPGGGGGGGGSTTASSAVKSRPMAIRVPSTRKKFVVTAAVTTCSVGRRSPRRKIRPVKMPDTLEQGALLLQIEDVARRVREVDDVAVAHVGPDVDQPGRVLVRQLPQQHRVDDAEDRGAGADAECNREHGGAGEGRALPHRAGRRRQRSLSSVSMGGDG